MDKSGILLYDGSWRWESDDDGKQHGDGKISRLLLKTGIPLMLVGLAIIAYTQYTYMLASLGCGPRDTLLVALAKRLGRVPIGAVSIGLLSLSTLIGWLLGGPVGVGTLVSAFGSGPIMQLAFASVRFDATTVRHQGLAESLRVLIPRRGKA